MKTACSFLVVATLGLLISCAGEHAEPLPENVVWAEARALVTTESGLLAGPVDLTVDADGTLYILDARDNVIQRIAADGAVLEPIGGPGAGPGEFSSPGSICVSADTLWVVDRRNGRLQALTPEGQYLSAFPLAQQAVTSLGRVGPGGRILVTVMPRDSALALLFDRGGEVQRRLGTPIAEVPDVLDFTAIRQEVAEGEIPGFFRNRTLLDFSPTGDIWMTLVAEGVVRRYGADGSLLVEAQLDEPEFAVALEEFFRRNQEPTEIPSIFSLQYISDVRVVGSDLWALLNTGDEGPGVIVVLSPDGAKRRRIELPSVQGAGAFAVDLDRGRLYLTVPSAAAVMAVDMGGRRVRGRVGVRAGSHPDTGGSLQPGNHHPIREPSAAQLSIYEEIR